MGFFYGLVSNERYCEIGEFAEFLWSEYSVRGRIDPFQLLKEKEITYSFRDYGDAFDGLLEYENGEFHVFLNQHRLLNPGSRRTRFTVCHELGHYFIDEHRKGLTSGKLTAHGSFSGYQSNEIIEVEADHFASHLLMPSSLFSEKVANQVHGLKAIIELSKTFDTSREACGVRYVKEGILPCALFKWNNDKLIWKLLSDDFYRLGLRHSIKKGSPAPEDSGTQEVLMVKVKPTGVVKRESRASIWFPNISVGSSQDEILIEETISLSKFGALTLVYKQSS